MMQRSRNSKTNRTSRLARGFLISALALTLSPSMGWAQGETAASKSATGPTVVQYFHLNNTPPYGGNEVVTALRNILNPSAKITLVLSQNIIIVASAPDQI